MSRVHPSSDAAPPVDVGAELRAVAAAWAEAIVSNDAARISMFVSDDWEIVSESGVSPGQELLALIASSELSHSAMRAVTEPHVRVFGEVAVLTTRVTNTAHFGGKRFDADEWTTDVFVRGERGWLCTLTHYTPARDGT